MPPTVRLTRRELAFAATLAGAHALVPPAFARIIEPRGQEGPGRFLDGVASGEPSHDAVTFWSRLSTDRPVSGARLVVAEDEQLTRTVATAVIPTSRSVDGSLKTRIGGLQPGRHYWYVWQSADDVSPVGRTKTAPHPTSDEQVNVGFSSCQNFPVGFFNAHADAAKADLDLYAFLGDYTYEYDSTEDADIPARGDVASVDLRSYRSKLRLYRQDPDLRELHRLHPVVHIWDDHEVADNYSDNDPRPSDQQRSAGYRASFEWLPRMAMPEERFRTYKPIRLGRTAELFLLDQRQYRTGDGDGQPKSILGRTQMEWLKRSLAATDARWKLIGNQAMFTPLRILNAIPANMDQWDGYPDERAEVEQLIQDRALQNVTFLTGDIHLFIAADNRAVPASSFATEYVGGSVTSTGVPEELAPVAGPAIIANNLNMRYFNGHQHGWSLARVGKDEMRVDYRASDITVQGAQSSTIASFRQAVDTNRVERLTGDEPDDAPLGQPLRAKPGSDLAARRARFRRAFTRDLERRAR